MVENKVDGRNIALKEMNPAWVNGMMAHEAGFNQLKEEVNLMQQFHHPNVVRYLGCHVLKDKAQFYIFMEYMAGPSLEAHLESQGAPKPDKVQAYTKQMCLALQYLHRNGILHRDMKAGNVLLDYSLEVAKLTDFGTSVRSFEDSSNVGGRSAASLGGFTAAFCAPEVVNGKWTVDEETGEHFKVDVWALGCTVIQMLTSTRGSCPDDAWEHCPEEHLPLHQNSSFNNLEEDLPGGARLHQEVDQPCWVCALQKGVSPHIPEDEVAADLRGFLELCFQIDPKSRSTCDRLADTPYLGELRGVAMGMNTSVALDAKTAGFTHCAEGHLRCDGQKMSDICIKLASEGHIDHRPFVLHSASKITLNCHQIQEALGIEGGAILCFPLNARHSPQLLKTLRAVRPPGVSVLAEMSGDLQTMSEAKLPLEACVVNGTAQFAQSELRDFIAGSVSFCVYSSHDMHCLQRSLLDPSGELRKEVDTLKRVKVLLPSAACPPPGLRGCQGGLKELLDALKQFNAKDGGRNILDGVGLHCAPGEDLISAAAALTQEVDLIKAASIGERKLFSICVNDLDGRILQGRGVTPGHNPIQAFVSALSGIPAQVFVNVASEIMEGGSLQLDRVLHWDSEQGQLTLQQGLSTQQSQLSLMAMEVSADTPTRAVSLQCYKQDGAVQIPEARIPKDFSPNEMEEPARIGVMPLPVSGALPAPIKEFMAKMGEDSFQVHQVST